MGPGPGPAAPASEALSLLPQPPQEARCGGSPRGLVLPPLSARRAAPSSSGPILGLSRTWQAGFRRSGTGSRPSSAPIWLGCPDQDEEAVFPRSILELVPQEHQQDSFVQEVEALEQDADGRCHDGRYVEAAERLEQALELRRRLLGGGHPEAQAALEAYVGLCNSWGLRCVRAGSATTALVLLKKAEAATEAGAAPNLARRLALRAATFRNLCCYFRSRGKLHAALQYAERSLALPAVPGEPSHSALLELNCAALLSAVGRREDALERLDRAREALQLEEQNAREQALGEEQQRRCRLEASLMLVALRHNVWLELSQLGREREAADSLRQAVQSARQRLGAAHPLTAKVEEALAQVQDQLSMAPQRRPAAALKALPAGVLPAELRLKTRKDGTVPVAVRLAICPPAGPPPPRRACRARAAGAGPEGRWDGFEARPRVQAATGYVGSPAVQLQAFGGEPFGHEAPASRPSRAGAGADGAAEEGCAGAGAGHGEAEGQRKAAWHAEPSRLAAIGLLRSQLEGRSGGGEAAQRAAVVIQAAYRGHRARLWSGQVAQEAHESASKLQAAYRKHRAQREARSGVGRPLPGIAEEAEEGPGEAREG